VKKAGSNNHVNRTAHKLRLWVPSVLRAPAAGYVERWAAIQTLYHLIEVIGN
jgi:hypothetical protein